MILEILEIQSPPVECFFVVLKDNAPVIGALVVFLQRQATAVLFELSLWCSEGRGNGSCSSRWPHPNQTACTCWPKENQPLPPLPSTSNSISDYKCVFHDLGFRTRHLVQITGTYGIEPQNCATFLSLPSKSRWKYAGAQHSWNIHVHSL